MSGIIADPAAILNVAACRRIRRARGRFSQGEGRFAPEPRPGLYFSG